MAQAQELNRLFRQSKDFESFYRSAKLQFEIFNKKWLESEYNTAALTGEAAATYHRLIKQTDLFPYWEYKTVNDDKVRYSHRPLHGLILPANDPRWKKLFPPNDWNCRCYIVPRTKAEVESTDLTVMRERADYYLDSAEFIKAEAQGWGVNRAEAGEVFTANQFYIKKFPGKAAKLLDSLQPSDYGLKQYSQAKKIATEAVPIYKGSAADFYKENKILRDYHNRPIELDKKNFERHTTGRREYRVEYLDGMKAAMLKPDEVWINGTNYDDFVTIKYYKDRTIVVISSIRNGRVYQIDTWFPLSEKADVINRYRTGLLIYGLDKK